MTWGCTMAGPYLSWSCSTADCQLRLSVLYGTMQVHYVELQSGSEDEASILNAKTKERHQCKQVKREEKQCREEAEAKAHKEAEHQACEQVEKDRVEVQQRAAGVTARQRVLDYKQTVMVCLYTYISMHRTRVEFLVP